MSEFDNVLESETPAAEPVAAEPAQPAPVAQDDDIPEAVEVRPGERMVPVGVIKALREELKARPKAEDLATLKQQLDEARPYAEFLRNNPHLLQPQQPAQPQQPTQTAPQEDQALVELARTLELYDAQTGKPDVGRAAKIRDLTRSEAQQIAQQTIAPVQERTHEQQAANNLQQIVYTAKTADGAPLKQEYLMQAVRSITGALPKGEAMRVLADPTVAEVIKLTALGLQSINDKSAPQAPAAPPLHIESPGGGNEVVLSDGSRRLARMTGRSEADWQKSASRYVPGRANSLE